MNALAFLKYILTYSKVNNKNNKNKKLINAA